MRLGLMPYCIPAVIVWIAGSSSSLLLAQSPGDLIGVTPCRVVDTRGPNGPFGGPIITGGTTRVFTIPLGACSIPSDAVAYSLNISVVPPGPLGYITVWPDGQSRPLAATLVDSTGLVLSNGAIIQAGASGAIDVFVSNTTHVVIDIDGYFLPQTNPANDSTALGVNSLLNNTGTSNSAFGSFSLVNATGNDNTGSGALALSNSTSGSSNTAVGFESLYFNGGGSNNTAVGSFGLGNNTSGNNNIGVGYFAGQNIVAGNNNIEIGASGSGDESGAIRIGTQGTQTNTFIAGINNATVTGSAVFINSNGQLGVTSSSIRYKDDVRDMGESSDALMLLRPVTFRYKKANENGSKPLQYGLIGEEVQKIYPELVVYGRDGQVESVQYHQLPALLLNEVQKEHRTIERQQEQIQELEARIALLERLLQTSPESKDTAAH